MQKILSSALIMAMVSIGAYAADEMITGGAGTCTVDVLGVSADGATANTIAVWSIDKYTLAPGEYLNVTETSVEPAACPPGSYCVGGADFTVENAATSIATCPTEYPNSRAGAGAQTQCYTACTVATANIAHATAVGGNDYFGDGADACFATDCDTGYHVDGDIEIIEKTPLIPVDYRIGGDERDAAIEINGETYRDYSKYGLTVPGTWAGEFDYGIVYGRASCQPYGTNVVMDYVLSTYADIYSGKMSLEDWQAGLESLAGKTIAEFVTEILAGALNGTVSDAEMYRAEFAVLATEFDSNYQIADAGDVCYCQIDGFAPMTDGVLETKRAVMYAPWVYSPGFQEEFNGAGDCAADCASYCAYSMISNDHPYDQQNRAALYGVLDYIETGICAANTINIDWNPDNGGDHTQNMCTYDGEITLPTPDPVKPGYTFTGWKLLEETTAE